MRFSLVLFFSLTIFSVTAQNTSKEDFLFNEENGYYYLPNQIVLTFYENPNSTFIWKESDMIRTFDEQVNEIFTTSGVNNIESVPTVDSIFIVHCSECDAKKLVEELLNFKHIFRFVELHYIYELTTCPGGGISTNDPVSNQSLRDQISVDCAWNISTGDNAVVGLPDVTGNGLVNSDIQGKVLSNQNYTNTTFTEHGHNMGGLIAAETDNNLRIPSVGFNTQLRTYNIAFSANFVSSTAIVSAINQAVADNVDVINMSFTWLNSGSLKQAVDNAYQADIVIVTSAGNNSYSNGCNSSSVICVTSVDGNDAHGPTNNQSSGAVDLSAPDRGFVSLSSSGTQVMYRGTSQSTALVSGTAALMHDVFPNIKPFQIETFLECSADDISGISDNGTTYNGLIGAGRLNVYRAVQQAEIYGSFISGAEQVCPNDYEYYSLPYFEGANYNWTVNGNATLITGQGTKNIQVRMTDPFWGAQIECEITIGNCVQIKSETLSPHYNCGSGGYYMNLYPNPTAQSSHIKIELIAPENSSKDDSVNLDESTVIQYSIHDSYGQVVRSFRGDIEETYSIQNLNKGIYTIIAVFDKETVRGKLYIQ